MSAGNSNFAAVAGGGNQRANASQLARWLLQLGVCTNGAANGLLNPGSDVTSLRAQAGLGPLAEAGAFRQRSGQPCYLMPINASAVGAIGTVGSTGSGNATVAATAAPHQAITIKCVIGGVLGTAQFQASVGGGAFGATFTPSVGTPTQQILGTFCTVTFPSATYVVSTTATIGVTGTVTLGTNWVGSITQASSPIDYYEMALSVAATGGFGVGMFQISPDGGLTNTGGGSTLPPVSIPTNGVISIPGTGLVLTIGQHTILITITTGGVLGTAIYSYQIDGGTTVTAQATTPNSGSNYVVTIPGTGVTLTFPAGTYVLNDTFTTTTLGAQQHTGTGTALLTSAWAGLQANDTFAFLTAPPGHSTTDLNTALTAAQNARNVQWSGVHVVTMPSTAAGAVSAQATVDAAMAAAYTTNNLDWQGLVECPSSGGRMGLGDIVISGGLAIADVADTDTVLQAARGADTNRTALHVGSYRLVSALTSFKLARPLGWLAADRFVDTDPANDLSAYANGPLRAFLPAGWLTIGRDESVTPGLDNVQFNSARTYQTTPGVFLTITSSGAGWKNCTVQSSWQDARGVRVLNIFTQQLRPVAQFYLASSPPTNPDGTIEELTRRSWSSQIDGAAKRGVGLLPGGPFATRQASFGSASISAASQLGQAPKQLVTNYFLQQLGFVSSSQNNVYFSGTLVLSQ